MKLIKKVIGIDISKDTFKVRFGILDSHYHQTISSKSYTFANRKKGFYKFLQALNNVALFKSTEEEVSNVPVWFVLEATGVYYENLAYFLLEKKFLVTVLLPNKVKHFSKTLNSKSKTDDLDAAVLTQYGLEKQLSAWNMPNSQMKQLKELSREYQNLVDMTTQIKNKLHAKRHSFKPVKETIKRLEQQLNFYKKQIKEVKKQIEQTINCDEELKSKINNIITIKGVNLITIVNVIAETNGFALVKNNKQITSYAGYDVVLNESGEHKGKTRISKKGNHFIRRSLYFPALSAARWNDDFKALYKRLCIKKVYKKIAITAVARKLLILIYTLWKKNEKFIPNYQRT
jgi:transposase